MFSCCHVFATNKLKGLVYAQNCPKNEKFKSCHPDQNNKAIICEETATFPMNSGFFSMFQSGSILPNMKLIFHALKRIVATWQKQK
jgi:hypothetical protein